MKKKEKLKLNSITNDPTSSKYSRDWLINQNDIGGTQRPSDTTSKTGKEDWKMKTELRNGKDQTDYVFGDPGKDTILHA